MEFLRQSNGFLFVLLIFISACSPSILPSEHVETRVTLDQVGRRLSDSKSAIVLTKLAAREARLLAQLDRVEREQLSHNHLRFRVDRPTTLILATPAKHIPFWLHDQGFQPRSDSLEAEHEPWLLFEKSVTGDVSLGVDRLDSSPLPHYALFVVANDGEAVELRGLDPDRFGIAEGRRGESLGQNFLVRIDQLPPFLEGSKLVRPTEDLRNSTRLASGKLWKTHVVATRRPDQTHISPGDDPATELRMTWRTDTATNHSVSRLREMGSTAIPLEIKGESDLLRTANVVNDPEVRIHHANWTNLKAGTRYEYSNGDGTPEGMSPWTPIRTAPTRTADLQLLYMGDPQCGLEGWGKLLSKARERHPQATVLLIAGDLVDRGNERTNWDHFFLRAKGVFETLPIVPAVGNHEYLDSGPRLYRAFFDLPKNGPNGIDPTLVYSVEYGDLFLAVLDSTLAVSDPSSAAKQGQWLDAQLEATTCSWKIVMFHHPLYASHPWRESQALRDVWVPIIDKHRVQLVLQGHDHAYLRTYPMRANQRSTRGSDGCVYVVSVSGDKYCDQNPRDYTEVGFTNRSTYQTIDVKPRDGLMTYRCFDIEGRELDRYEWSRIPGPASVARQ